MDDYMENRRKIGVLTFHTCINYGSYWQARCLVEGLQTRGHDAVLIHHRSERVNRREWRCGFQPTLPTPTPKADRPHYREKMRRFFRAFEALPLSPCFDLDNPADMDDYDRVVVGSDEVWNIMHPWYGGCALFYGDGVRAEQLVSYAASFGNYPASHGLDSRWADHLRRFACVSVRDDNSACLIRNALGFEPDMVLDPCLQFPPEADLPHYPDVLPVQQDTRRGGSVYPSDTGAYADAPLQADRTITSSLQEPYAAVYGHNFSPRFIEAARRWAKARGLRLVSIGYRNDWADEQWLTAGPEAFAFFMCQAEAVLTNFFHGCVFALLNMKPFICEPSGYRSYKVQGLMRTVGAEDHLLSEDWSPREYDAVMSEPLDGDIRRRIIDLRQASDAYLDRALA
jgi:hypothetical protein